MEKKYEPPPPNLTSIQFMNGRILSRNCPLHWQNHHILVN